MSAPWRLLLFGASGSIGRAVVEQAALRDWAVTRVTRGVGDADARREDWIRYDPIVDEVATAFAGCAAFDAVCWAHGANMSDSLASFDAERHLDLYRANVLSVLIGASSLLEHGLLSEAGSRLVVVSSIWQERARQEKLSYAVTKAALGGLVRAASVDLAAGGHLINAVLPGVLDTPMSLANLSPAQLSSVANKTKFGRLPDLGTVAAQIAFLCSAENRSISGQSIAIDLGLSNATLV